ncbi:alpha/beta hydrolase family protein [Kineococcus sp. SYSU DK001]|uniref:alpha/beta hydrolase family protein n=1 Tax=Kineococcus sp. SYSU DK001 TaxID=3383122 RepID=UPI003D7E73DF
MRVKKRRGIVALLLVVAVALALAGAAAVGWDFRHHEEHREIPVAAGTLDAVLARPEAEPRGLVVVVHGDGPVDATHDGLYRPWFEAAADAGFATLSWSKPGVGGSSGNWLDQSMEDRAQEVGAVLDWAAAQRITDGPVVLWGASQAGWVLPRVAATRPEVTAVVAVSPAVNWLRQGRFNLLATGGDVAVSDRTRELLAQGADHARYVAESGDPDPMAADRWGFVLRNFRSDATADLEAMAGRHLPVLLDLGEHDENVDVDETERTYRRILGADVTVRRYDAAHSMARTGVEDSDVLGVLTAVFRPRHLLADGVLDDYREFLRAR